jgi:hypothetical protein
MEKNVFFLVLVTFSSLAVVCQVKVPDAVKTAFNNKFPTASSVKWEKESKTELEANFKMNNTDVSANFSLDGSWVETETTIPASELPAPVTNAVNTKYQEQFMEEQKKLKSPVPKYFTK